MEIHRIFSFVFTSVATGLAAAFIVTLLRPDFLDWNSPVPATAPAATVSAAPHSYADAVAAAAPAVVNIYATKLTREKGRPLFDDPIFQRYFGNPLSKPRLRRENSLGSGVVVNSNGYILTNHHVVESASEINIVVDGYQPIPARVVGTDPDTDLAVIQAGGKDLPVATLGSSEELRVGDVVLAIGNPFGVGKTVTQGIVSAVGRHQLGLANYEDFIQTDAAINQGNSGGALVNARGEVVGVNTAMLSRSGGSHGIGFAIPIALARQVMDQILTHGQVIRGWIGISGQDLTTALADSLEIEEVTGVLVSGVLEKGPADRAGIRPGDVIRKIDELQVENSYQILNKVATVPPGSVVELTIYRDNREIVVQVDVAARPKDVD